MNLLSKLPTHVGIIMDGNGRWAKKRHLPRLAGHKAGIKTVEEIVGVANDLGIKVITFFAFSTENWKRDNNEVYGIFDIVRNYLQKPNNALNQNNVKLTVMGDPSKLPKDLQQKLNEIVLQTQNNSGMILNLAINYGARDELVRAFNCLADLGKKVITETDIRSALYSASLPDPDLIIRTSGEMRLSNFMLFQIAYAELYFTKVYWPSFKKKHFIKALKSYARRDRRYGGNHKKLEKK